MFGIIGGTGLYNLAGFKIEETHRLDTPFGETSGAIVTGMITQKQVCFLPRHGEQHQILPSEVNYRANIWALKKLGVKSILAISAVGSLHKALKPGDFAAPVQYIDFTRGQRKNTFFGQGLVAHVSMAHPICPILHKQLTKCIGVASDSIHANATYACVEGPRLGTKAESHFLQQSGATLVGMTNIPEVFLAREAQISYATLAIVTDYDSWLEDESQFVNVAMAIETYKNSIGRVQELIPQIVENYQLDNTCIARNSLKDAILTKRESLNFTQQELLNLLES